MRYNKNKVWSGGSKKRGPDRGRDYRERNSRKKRNTPVIIIKIIDLVFL